MASVKVAVRVRPVNRREEELESNCIICMNGKKTTIFTKSTNIQGSSQKDAGKDFTYDYSYCSMDKQSSDFASQVQVFKDLGVDVINSAYDGYNACVFAYGQTGSGKTYTMMGSHDDVGLIPRICEGLFAREKDDASMTYRTEVSYLEIYNEKVRDLLKANKDSQQSSLRVREHPKEGPYVQDLSKHIVADFNDIKSLMDKGNAARTTASTNMNDTSSRSHAIFTIVFTQAKFIEGTPSETHSKIHLVDLAGSERANATGATGQRLKEGSSINTSLVTLGNVISSLADMSEKPGAIQNSNKKQTFIPYRNSVLTWLLKDSLGGNSKTIMIATISPAECNYSETLSTLRYANRAKNIVNKPTVNEDRNVKLIRELRSEIDRLKALLGGNIDCGIAPKVQEKLHENEARVKVLTEEWTEKWKEVANILNEEKTLALRKEGLGVVLDSQLPHLIGIDDNILRTGIMLYHIKEGRTTVGTAAVEDTQQHIVLQGANVCDEHCVLEHVDGHVTLIPTAGALCCVNGVNIEDPIQLTQGSVILLGSTNMFRFNHPEQAAKMREMKDSNGDHTGVTSGMSTTLSKSMTDLARSTENLALLTSGWEMEQKHLEQLEMLEKKRQQIEELEEQHQQAEMDRKTEQEQQEEELKEKKKLLEEMQEKLNQSRKEVEQIETVLKKESAKLKRQSQDIDRQYAEYLEEKSLFEQQKMEASQTNSVELITGGKLESTERTDVDDAKELLKVERESLIEEEKRMAEEYVLKQATLKQKKELFEKEYKEKVDIMEQERQELKKKQEEIDRKMEAFEHSALLKEQEISHLRENVLVTIAEECARLEEIKGDESLMRSYLSELDDKTKDLLLPMWSELHQQQQSVKDKEAKYYQEFVALKGSIEEEKEAKLSQITTARDQLEVDKVYLQDCEEQFDMTETDDVQRSREQIALQSEKERITAETEELLVRQDNAEEEEEIALKELQAKRDRQVEEVVKDKERVNMLEKELMSSVQRVIDDKVQKSDELESKIQAYESELSEMRSEEGAQTTDRFIAEQTSIQQTLQTLNDLAVQQQRDYQLQLQQVEDELRHVKCEEEQAKERLAEKSCRLQLLEQERLACGRSAGDTSQFWSELSAYKQLREDSDSAGDSEESNESLVQRIRELRHLEQQLRSSENDLEKRREYFEMERQLELDNIAEKRYQLEEMEHQKKINSLVDREVKRKLYNERKQREKQRREEREQDRQERNEEMSKLKQAHNKALEKLKEKYESQDTHVNMPTRANPYASPMIRDVSPGTLVKTIADDQDFHTVSLNPEPEDNDIHISIPMYLQRGSGLDYHYVYEVKIEAGSDVWCVYRRYSKFRELHHEVKQRFPQVSELMFPPKKWFGNTSEHHIKERRKHLENYLIQLIALLKDNQSCLLHVSHAKLYSKQVLQRFHPFFQRGLFEVGRCGTS